MGGFNFNIPGINFNPQMLQNIQQGAAMVAPAATTAPAAPAVPSAVLSGRAPGVVSAGTTGLENISDSEIASSLGLEYTGERDMDQMIQDKVQQVRQEAARAAGQGLSPAQIEQGFRNYQNTVEQLRADPAMREQWFGKRDFSSAIGDFVDSIGGPAGLFGLTVGALTGGLGYAGMLGSAGSGAAAGAITGAVSGDPLRAGLAGAAGGVLGAGANAALGGAAPAGAAPAGATAPSVAAPSVTAPTAGSLMAPSTAAAGTGASGAGAFNLAAGTGLSGAGAAGGGINLAATGIPAFTGATGAGTAATGLGTLGAASAAPAVGGGILGGASPAAGAINIGAGTGLASPAAGSINLGAAGLGAAAPAVSTTAPLTMSGLLGGTSPAAGAINLGAAGLGTAAGGTGVANNIFGSVADFFGMTPGGLAASIGQAGLGYLGQQEQADLARELAAQAQFQPYNVAGPLGNVTVEGQQINISPTEQQAALQQQLFGLTGGALGRAQDPALQSIFQQAPGQLQQLTQQFIGQETAIPGAAQALASQLGRLGGQATQFGTQGIQQAFGAPSAMQALQGQSAGAAYQAAPSSVSLASGLLEQAPRAGMISARGSVSGLLGGAAPGVSGMGISALGGALAPSREEGLVSQAAGAGLGLLAEGTSGARGLAGEIAGAGGELLRGAQAPSFNQLASERLASLRAAARTGEERTTQAALERLYGQGRLGTTGGQRALGELARAQEEADIARTVAAQDFAQQQQNIAAQQALQQQQLGAGLLGTGLAGQQFLAQQGQGLLGMGAQVGQFGRSLGANIGQFGVGLGEQARQADIRNILAATGQDVSQLQFGATLGEQQRAQNLQSLLAAQSQDIGQRQFGASFGEQQRQANLEAQLQAVQADQLQAARLGQLGQGLLGLGAEIPATVFEAQRLADQARLARGAQRIAAAEGLFGFGQAARAGELGMGLEAMQAQQAQFNPLIQLANIASGMGSAQALGAARGAGLQYDAFGSPYTAGSTFFGGLLQPRTQRGA